jgi:serine O-acetyltransferase
MSKLEAPDLMSDKQYTPEELWAAGWGIAPDKRRNRPIVRLLVALTPPRRLPHRYLQRFRILLHRGVSVLVSSDFRAKSFGSELFMPHPYGIVVHAETVIGDRVTLMQNVTLGENQRTPGVPTLGNDIVIGAGACVLGPITIGDGATVAAGAIVIRDVEPGATVVGNPARPIGVS